MTNDVMLTAWDDFVDAEMSTGGPDAQIDLAVAWAQLEDQALWPWRLSTFIVPYNLCTGAAISVRFPTPESVLTDPDAVYRWCHENKAGLRVRKERRHMWGMDKFAKSLLGYATWVQKPELYTMSYTELWGSVDRELPYTGRYMAMKLLEALRRAGITSAYVTDVRPRGAKYVRRALDHIYGTDLEHLGNDPASVEAVNWAALAAFDALTRRQPTWYQLEVNLCNFRQGLSYRYVGRTHDEELEHYRHASEYWGHDLIDAHLPLYRLREALFPVECLGESQGWSGYRDELGTCWKAHGYMWADTIYSYLETTDLANPVKWSDLAETS